jgi:hypothetical protein
MQSLCPQIQANPNPNPNPNTDPNPYPNLNPNPNPNRKSLRPQIQASDEYFSKLEQQLTRPQGELYKCRWGIVVP